MDDAARSKEKRLPWVAVRRAKRLFSQQIRIEPGTEMEIPAAFSMLRPAARSRLS